MSDDLRVRVIAAVEGGLSRNAAAARFGIAVASAVRWLRAWRESGATAAKPKGGDRRSHRIGALAWVEQSLAPTLDSQDIVVANNLACHKVAGVREAIEARGARILFLPSYSPDLNPIEQLFAKLKALIRRLAPRSRDALFQAIAEAIQQVSPIERPNYLANAGYGQPA